MGLRAFKQPVSLQRPTLCTEIALWLIAERVDLEAECRELHEGESPPYWAFCWGSGQALGRWLLDHPEQVSGRRVIDFGAGSGVVGIAAALAGATSVVAVDIDPAAREAIRRNTEANGVCVEVSASIPEDWDVFLATDVLYEGSTRDVIERIRASARETGRRAWVGEPDRPGNPGYAAEVVAEYPVRTLPDVDSPAKHARVFRLA